MVWEGREKATKVMYIRVMWILSSRERADRGLGGSWRYGPSCRSTFTKL